jgi:hypothetical protein
MGPERNPEVQVHLFDKPVHRNNMSMPHTIFRTPAFKPNMSEVVEKAFDTSMPQGFTIIFAVESI